MGPALRGFGVWDFAISNAKHHHTTTPKLQKSERKVGPALRGFGVHNNKRTQNLFPEHTWQHPASSDMLFINFAKVFFPPLGIFAAF